MTTAIRGADRSAATEKVLSPQRYQDLEDLLSEIREVDQLFVRPKHVARALGISIPSVCRYIRNGRIPATKIGDQLFIPRAVLESWSRETSREGGSGK